MGKAARKLTDAICGYLAATGWHVSKNGSACATNPQGQFYRVGGKSNNGRADLEAHKVLIRANATNPALVLWLCIEVKAGGDVVSPDQAVWHDRARQAGAIIVIARKCEDVERVVEKL